MNDVKFWKITKEDSDLVKILSESFERLYQNPPQDYRFELSHEGIALAPEDEELVFVIGSNMDNLLGYAICSENDRASDIGEISRLPQLSSAKTPLRDFNGNPVHRENLKNYEGFSKYTGAGKVLHIVVMDIFLQRKGFGSILMDYIKSQGYELIELEALDYEACQFFQANDFIDSGIDNDSGMMVMVWNNPGYF